MVSGAQCPVVCNWYWSVEHSVLLYVTGNGQCSAVSCRSGFVYMNKHFVLSMWISILGISQQKEDVSLLFVNMKIIKYYTCHAYPLVSSLYLFRTEFQKHSLFLFFRFHLPLFFSFISFVSVVRLKTCLSSSTCCMPLSYSQAFISILSVAQF